MRWDTDLLAELNSTMQMCLPSTLYIEWVEILISSVFYSLLYCFPKISRLISFWEKEKLLFKTSLFLQSQHNLVLWNFWILFSDVMLISLRPCMVFSFLLSKKVPLPVETIFWLGQHLPPCSTATYRTLWNGVNCSNIPQDTNFTMRKVPLCQIKL